MPFRRPCTDNCLPPRPPPNPVVSTSASGATWRTSAAAFTGREREGEDLPSWVCDAVLRGLLPYVKELKAAFVLHPAEGSSLPSLLQSRLNAPRILQVAKVGGGGAWENPWVGWEGGQGLREGGGDRRVDS
jgi:hypothetical protein